MRLFYARKTGKTELGSRYGVLQDDVTSVHVTLQRGNSVIYEHFDDVTSEDILMKHIAYLEDELIPKMLPDPEEKINETE